MVEMDSDFKFLEEYINHNRKMLEEGIFDCLPSDKHLQFYRDMSELVSAEDAFKASRQKILEEGEKSMNDSWIKEEDTDSWRVIIEREGNV